MILKEAFTYQNVLTAFVNKIIGMLSDTNYTVVTKQEHRRDKSKSANAEDWKMEVVQPVREYNIPAEKLITMLEDIAKEKMNLAVAIDVCKHTSPVSMDVLVEQNKLRSRLQSIFQHLGELKGGEKEFFSSDFTFNADGNQILYQYPVKEVTTIDFPRNTVKALQKKYTAEAAAVSLDIDKMQLTAELEDFTPRWTSTTTFDDLVEAYCGKEATEKGEE